MHADDFRNDLYGLVSGLRDGGYSDDMTLAAIAGNILVTAYVGEFIYGSHNNFIFCTEHLEVRCHGSAYFIKICAT